ncbi:MAG TPA: hypothetical protein VHG92_09430 [Afifellaceae bacterium]|nr:hypothetical protein [Afifellaceae bacterium]
MMTWRGAIVAGHAFRYGERHVDDARHADGAALRAHPIGFGLLTLQFALDLLAALRGRDTAEEALTEAL